MSDSKTLVRWLGSGAIPTSRARAVLTAMWVQWGDVTSEESVAWPSPATLGAVLGMRPNNVRGALTELRRAGAITRDDGKRSGAAVYRLLRCPYAPCEAVRTRRRANNRLATIGVGVGSSAQAHDQRAQTLDHERAQTLDHERAQASSTACADAWSERAQTLDHAVEPPRTTKINHAEEPGPSPAAAAPPDAGGTVAAESDLGWSLTHPDEPEPPPPPDPTEVTDEYIAEVCELMRRALVWVSEPWRPNARIRGPNPKSAGTRKLIRQIGQREAATLDDWRHVISAQAVDLCRKPDKIQYLSLPTIGSQWYRRSATALEPHEYLPWELPPVVLDHGEGESMIGDLPASPGGRVAT